MFHTSCPPSKGHHKLDGSTQELEYFLVSKDGHYLENQLLRKIYRAMMRRTKETQWNDLFSSVLILLAVVGKDI